MYKNLKEKRKGIMKYVIGAVVGLLWGALVAWVNSRINRRAIEKNDTKAMMSASLTRTVIDIVALGAVFLLRNVLPFNFEATIAGTAASLGLLTVYFAFQLSRPETAAENRGEPKPAQSGTQGGPGEPEETAR